MILTKILWEFWDSPEIFLFQKINFYILFLDIFKKGWFIVCFVSKLTLKYIGILNENESELKRGLISFEFPVIFSERYVLKKIIKWGAHGAKEKCSSIIWFSQCLVRKQSDKSYNKKPLDCRYDRESVKS